MGKQDMALEVTWREPAAEATSRLRPRVTVLEEGSTLLGPFVSSGHLCRLPGPAYTCLRELEGSKSKGWG